MSETKKILFMCIENAGRSQIAEGFFRKCVTSGYQPISTGTQPVSETNPLVIEVMKEVGIDISKQTPKMISKEMINQSTKIVNMDCMDKESCQALFLNNVIDWQIPDPKDKSIDKVREIRDEIQKKIKELVADLEVIK